MDNVSEYVRGQIGNAPAYIKRSEIAAATNLRRSTRPNHQGLGEEYISCSLYLSGQAEPLPFTALETEMSFEYAPTFATVPAPPGYKMVEYVPFEDAEQEELIVEEAVLAFVLDTSHEDFPFHRAIGLSSSFMWDSSAKLRVVEDPHGNVHAAHFEGFMRTREAWLEQMRKDNRARLKREAEARDGLTTTGTADCRSPSWAGAKP